MSSRSAAKHAGPCAIGSEYSISLCLSGRSVREHLVAPRAARSLARERIDGSASVSASALHAARRCRAARRTRSDASRARARRPARDFVEWLEPHAFASLYAGRTERVTRSPRPRRPSDSRATWNRSGSFPALHATTSPLASTTRRARTPAESSGARNPCRACPWRSLPRSPGGRCRPGCAAPRPPRAAAHRAR